MSSKKRSGLSKREYAAKASGGSLNYKSGKISTPKKSSSSKSSSSSRYNENQYIAYKMMDQMKGTNFADTYKNTTQKYDYGVNSGQIKDTVKKPSKSSVSTKNNSPLTGFSNEANDWMSSGSNDVNDYARSSQRASAAKVAGTSTSKPNIKTSNPTSLGKGLQWLNESLGSVYGKLTDAENPTLGLSQQLFGGDRGWTEQIQDILGTPVNAALRDDYETGGDYRNPQTISAINPWEVGTEAEDRARSQQIAAGNINPTTNYGTGFTTGYNNTGRISDDVDHGGNNDDNRRTSSRRVTNPIFQPKTPSISDILKGGSPQSSPDFSAGQTTNPTRRQFLGNGLLSKGTYGNGAGDYGVEGAINSDMDNTNFLDDLLTLVGIKPQVAYAAEKPSISTLNQRDTKPNNYSLNYTPLFQGNSNQPSLSQLFGYTGYKETPEGGMSDARGADLTEEQKDAQKLEQLKSELVYSYDGQDDIDWAESPNTTPITNQSNTMAFNNIGYNSNPAVQQYQDSIKGFKTQEKDTKKAYKKALSEMLKGIEAQYAQSQAVGESDLNKQKVNDLQALSSRFSFGLNQDPNSEQAIQYQQRTANDYAGQLTDFLAKLAAAKTQDIASARSGNQSNLMSALNSISNQKNSAQEKLANLLYTMQQDAQSNALKNKPNLYQMASGLKSQGNSWGNIAYQLGNAGFDLTPGNANSSALDSIMTGQVPQKAANLVSIGNGYVMDKTTGDVFQAYDPNNV